MLDSIPFLAGCHPTSAPVAPFPRVSSSGLPSSFGCGAGAGVIFEPARNHASDGAGPPTDPYPVSNTGGNPPRTYPVHVDYLTFTVPGFYFDNDVTVASRFLNRWTQGLFIVGGESTKHYNGYKSCHLIAPASGGQAPFLGWLGVSEASDNMKGWWCFCLPGQVTSEVVNWSELVKDMWDMRGRISRVDLALDDFDGVHPLAECESFYDSGLFNPQSGRPPQCRTIKHKIQSEGDTIYVGSRVSGKQLRCYEKGKQLGDENSVWVRYEGELLRKDKVIPWDVLLFSAQYLKGMYSDAFEWMPTAEINLAALKEKSKITLETAVKWLKQQGGKLIIYLREVCELEDTEIVEKLRGASGAYPVRLFDAARDSPIPSDSSLIAV
jgi:phage replication initiation protein